MQEIKRKLKEQTGLNLWVNGYINFHELSKNYKQMIENFYCDMGEYDKIINPSDGLDSRIIEKQKKN